MASTAPLYDKIGVSYDSSRRADPRIVDVLHTGLRPVPGARYLDLACGTGNYSNALAAMGVDITGLDISPTMLSQARAKNPDGNWVLGDAGALPFADGTFRGAICTLAIHHFDGLGPPFSELHRVVREGRLVVFTATPQQMSRYWVTHYFPDAVQRAAEQMPSDAAILENLRAARFSIVDQKPWHVPADLQDGFLYSGKHRPHLYLDAEFRRGISTFANLASAEEVAAGVRRLERDIESGAVWDIVESSCDEEGDYLFVIAETDGGADG